MLPVVAVGLWALVAVVAGVAYPAFVQRFRVEPEESSREAPYIEHNIEATRDALGLNNVETRPFDYTTDQAATSTRPSTENPGTIRNMRLLDPAIVQPTYQRPAEHLAASTGSTTSTSTATRSRPGDATATAGDRPRSCSAPVT